VLVRATLGRDKKAGTQFGVESLTVYPETPDRPSRWPVQKLN
jgi:hypothetical protein